METYYRFVLSNSFRKEDFEKETKARIVLGGEDFITKIKKHIRKRDRFILQKFNKEKSNIVKRIEKIVEFESRPIQYYFLWKWDKLNLSAIF